MQESTDQVSPELPGAGVVNSLADMTAAAEFATGLRCLAAMVEASPALCGEDGRQLQWSFERILVAVNTREQVAAYVRAGLAAGAKVTKHQNESYAGVDVQFGAVSLHVYVPREEVCERVVVATREVTEDVPDPDALAAVPKVTVTKTVEDVEWRCMPLLAELPGGAS